MYQIYLYFYCLLIRFKNYFDCGIFCFSFYFRYQFALSTLNKIFGAKAHKRFPKKIRLSGHGCSGDGFYPSKLMGGGVEYWADGIDLEIEEGAEVFKRSL
jgi:hypothetical protein